MHLLHSIFWGERLYIALLLLLQVWNALKRYGLTLDPYPRVKAVYDACLQVPAIQKALPEHQPDYSPPTN
jgi:glutathione S-transferase